MDFHSGKASKSVYLNKSNLNSQIWNYYDVWKTQESWNHLLHSEKDLLPPGELYHHCVPEFFTLAHASSRTTVHCIGFLCVYQFLRSFRAVSSKGKGLGNKKSWTRQSLASIYFWSHSEASHNSRCWLRRGICTHAMSILLSTRSVCCMNGNVLTRLEM